jgi:hypothetical protein
LHFLILILITPQSASTAEDNMKVNTSVAVAASTNPYLDADNHINVARIQALQIAVTKVAAKAQDAAPKPLRPIQTFVISRKAKPIRYSASSEGKKDLKYLSQRALKIGVVKRMTDRSSIRNKPLLTVYDKTVLGALADKVKLAVSAINSHLKRADRTRTAVTKAKTKIRDVAAAQFDKSVETLKSVLSDAGLKDTDMVIGTSMFGKTMLVKLPDGSVVSVGKSDLDRFKAAKKAAVAE